MNIGREPEPAVLERYGFVCRHCGFAWSWEYRVLRRGHPGGSLIETFFHDGLACSPPWSPPRCSTCGSVQVVLRGRE